MCLEVDVNDNKPKKDSVLICSVCSEKCSDCVQAFRHATEHHGVHTFLSCKLCQIFFMDNATLAEHKITHNDNCFTCEFCNEIFTVRNAFLNHVKTHVKVYRCVYKIVQFFNDFIVVGRKQGAKYTVS